LGLASVREIVREYGGAINVRSAPGAGSRFEVWLPCIVPAAAALRDGVSTLRLGSGETVLVVEDTVERLLTEEEMLAALGYGPVGFARAADALAACRADTAKIRRVAGGPSRFCQLGSRSGCGTARGRACCANPAGDQVGRRDRRRRIGKRRDFRGCPPAPNFQRDRLGFGALLDRSPIFRSGATLVTRFLDTEIIR
jgi:hypothetical protein